MAGDAIEVGGVLLSMRMVSGLYGNCIDPGQRTKRKKFNGKAKNYECQPFNIEEVFVTTEVRAHREL